LNAFVAKNIDVMVVTLDVSQPEMSPLKFEALENMWLKFVTVLGSVAGITERSRAPPKAPERLVSPVRVPN
jgi:hypothetical protein